MWRALPADHVWSGWAAVDKEPKAIWLYRLLNNWRRFELIKQKGHYALIDDKGVKIGASDSLSGLIGAIERVPSLEQAE
jgi:hypothetical protein